jgi:nucleoside phosphorylase
MRRLSVEDYTVGWICAIPVELAASMAMLDEVHPALPKDPVDNNSYTLGQIAGHNVVMACLPLGQYGITSAASVATDMRRTFKSLRISLMVGIGGGVPAENIDIRLGDVVVSKPGPHSGGVLQYDFGKLLAGGIFEQTGSLNAPSSVLLTALTAMQANHLANPSSFAEYLRPLPFQFSSPGPENDQLFEWTYDHVGGDNCEDCDKTRVEQRTVRCNTTFPIAHYGVIASGSQVMKDGRTRERLRREYGIVCFEMEAAGLMNHLQCAVIRGICDYSDSHKNKIWQPYAAATAAAYSKELLISIPSMDPGSSSGPDLPAQSAYVIFPHLLPSTAVGLGWLCTNARAPWIDVCPVQPTLTDRDIITVPSSGLRPFVDNSNAIGLFGKFKSWFQSRGTEIHGMIITSYEIVDLLFNSNEIFENLCQQDMTKEWLERVFNYGCNAYMIVGKHTLISSRDSLKFILALQYCRIKFRRRKQESRSSVSLASDAPKWKSVRVFVRKGNEESDDILEASLQDTFTLGDVDKEFKRHAFLVDNQVLIVSDASK